MWSAVLYKETIEEAWTEKPPQSYLVEFNPASKTAYYQQSNETEFRFYDRYIYFEPDYGTDNTPDPIYRMPWKELQKSLNVWIETSQNTEWEMTAKCSYGTAESNYGQIFNTLYLGIRELKDKRGSITGWRTSFQLGSIDDLDFSVWFDSKEFADAKRVSNRLKAFIRSLKEFDLKKFVEYARSEGFSFL
jgi:hypothetical protein